MSARGLGVRSPSLSFATSDVYSSSAFCHSVLGAFGIDFDYLLRTVSDMPEARMHNGKDC